MKNIYILIYFLLCLVGVNNAQYADLFDFNGTNGNQPSGDLISDGTYLYGMTGAGGTNNMGVIFKINPDGTGYSKLLDFDSVTIGGGGGYIVSDGTFLYGMTSGNIFKIKPDGTGYFKLLDFTGANGTDPTGSLTWDGTFLYGMTFHGGTNGLGGLFKIKPNGTGYNKLLDFTGANGANPNGSLIFDGTFLYGMTRAGGSGCGAYGCGVVFKIKTDGTGYSDLYNFGPANGANPEGSLIYDGTFLYGMTSVTIFKIRPDGAG